ncbi:MAG: hypothetical protein ACYC3Q_05000 [Gemmatimonadaceae bacterium]
MQVRGSFPAVPLPVPARGQPAGVSTGQAPAAPSTPAPAPAATPRLVLSGGAPSELAAEAPTGTDPELWAVLSSDERRMFAQLGTMGPLSYGKYSGTTAGAFRARGGRLDVRG